MHTTECSFYKNTTRLVVSFVHAELHACCCCERQPGGSTRNKAEPNVDPTTKRKIKEEQRKWKDRNWKEVNYIKNIYLFFRKKEKNDRK